MTNNAVRAKENEIKNRELELKNKKLPAELALMEQEKHTSRSAQRLNETKRDMAPFDTAAGMAQGIGKGLAGIAAMANDFSFYTKTGDSMLNLLRKSTTDQAGRSKQIKDIVALHEGEHKAPKAFDVAQDWKAGIYVYDFVPSIDHSLEDSSSTAIAIRKFNTRVRGDNSGATNYDSVDLFQYLLATDSIATILAWCERGLDLINYKDTRDLASLNDNLLVAHCWGRADLAAMFRRDTTGVINVMNRCINQLDALQIPFEIDYIKRHAWLAKKIFTYGTGISKRYVMFRPEIYRVYDEASGSLKAYSFRARMTRFADDTAPYVFTNELDNILDSIVGPLATSQATATMSGDIAKAFGYEGIQFNKYPLNYADQSSPAFEEDEKYLMSIRNAIISPLASTEKDKALWGDELKDLSIRQAINSRLNPVLFMGHLYESGDAQETCGPSLNKANVTWIYANADDEVDGSDDFKKANFSQDVFNYIDYRDTFISEEDQLYNYSFRHNYMIGKDDNGQATTGIDNCRSEIIVRGQIIYTDTADAKIWRTGTFETFMEDQDFDVEYGAVAALAKLHFVIEHINFYHHVFGSEKFAPAIYEFFCVEGEFSQFDGDPVADGMAWIYLIWDRHFHREVNTTWELNQINYEALVNLFIQGNSMNKSRTKKNFKGKNRK